MSMRPVDIAGRLLDRLGILDRVVRRSGGRYVMAYHRVLSPAEALAEWCHPAIWITPETFDAHLRYFARVGRIVPLQDLLDAPDEGGPLFALTFDDAWQDNYTHAVPIMARHGATACFFVPTDAVSSGRLFWTEELALKLGEALNGPRRQDLLAHLGWTDGSTAELLPRVMSHVENLKDLGIAERDRTIASLYAAFGIPDGPVQGRVMTWDQIRELAALGHTIGSHSKTHLILRGVERARVDEELVESKQIVERELARSVDYFCFPNARYDDVSSERVLAAGYSHGFRIHNLKVRRDSHRALVPRFSASETNSLPSHLKLRFARASLA